MCSILSTDVWKWRVRNTLVSWHTCFIVLFPYLFSSSVLILQCIVMWLHQMKWTFTSQGGEILWLPFPHMEGEYFVGDTKHSSTMNVSPKVLWGKFVCPCNFIDSHDLVTYKFVVKTLVLWRHLGLRSEVLCVKNIRNIKRKFCDRHEIYPPWSYNLLPIYVREILSDLSG